MSNPKLTETGISKLRTQYREAMREALDYAERFRIGERLDDYSLETMIARGEYLAKFLFEITRYRLRVRRAFDRAGFERDVDNRLRIAARDFLYEIQEDAAILQASLSTFNEHLRALRQTFARAGQNY